IRQSLASRAFWLLLGLSIVGILLCLSVSVQGATAVKPAGEIELFGADRQPFTGMNNGRGAITLGFGAIHVEQWRDPESSIRMLEILLALIVGGALGMLLLLLWASGFLPEFLRPRAASVLLTKPIPRWALLVGKFLGVLAVVAVQVAFFVLGTWAALGFRTGVWHPGYLVCIPMLVLEFAVLYSFSVLIAVWTRNTAVCVVGSLVLWALCSAVNFNRLAVVAHTEGTATASPVVGALYEVGYWLLPKPVDLETASQEALEAEKHFRPLPEVKALESNRSSLVLSVLTSLLFSAALLALAGRRLTKVDY
ncbi:MAG TPA: ABC transporter permease subunit, partial [Gemmataceae bacterium]|nr:ABC transporter permease subunit [Gemmataceae bacterium]